MRTHLEEEPDEEPDEEPAEQPQSGAAPPPVVSGPQREFEYKSEVLTQAELVAGERLPKLLAGESAEGWDLVDVFPVGEQHVVLLRRQKKIDRESRRVGFAPPG
jgi:hypothetical protein